MVQAEEVGRLVLHDVREAASVAEGVRTAARRRTGRRLRAVDGVLIDRPLVEVVDLTPTLTVVGAGGNTADHERDGDVVRLLEVDVEHRNGEGTVLQRCVLGPVVVDVVADVLDVHTEVLASADSPVVLALL